MYKWNNLLKCSKYKKHRKLHIGCHWVYGTTVIPYEDHNVYDQELGADSERLAVLGATGSVKTMQQKLSTRHWKQTETNMLTGKRLFLHRITRKSQTSQRVFRIKQGIE